MTDPGAGTGLTVFLTIAAMAGGTYLTRIAGFLVASRIRSLPPRIQRFMDHLPGTIIIAIIAPQIASGGWITWSAAALCLVLSLAVKNLMAVMTAGVVYVSLIRWLA